MKKNNRIELKPYQKALDNIKGHYLLSSIFSQINILIVDKNQHHLYQNIEVYPQSFAQFIIKSNTSATILIHKENKFQEKEWEFVFLVMGIFLGLGFYKKLTQNKIKNHALFLFCVHYIKNILGISNIPNMWNSFYQIEEFISFKNEDSIGLSLENDYTLYEKSKNISLSNQENLNIHISKEKNYQIYHKNFEELFVENLIEQAQRTIRLKSLRNLDEEEINKQKTLSYKAKKWFMLHYPLLAALVSSFDIVENIEVCKSFNIDIAAVSEIDKKIYINPSANLNEQGMKFVIAHEILHIALNHSRRRSGRDHLIWNLACDFVINHWLVEMNIGIPPHGVYLDKDLAYLSADEIYFKIAQDIKLKKKLMTFKDKNAGQSKSNKSCDILDYDETYFSEFADACKEALLRGYYLHESSGRGDLPASLVEEIKMINQPSIPWQVELAEWITVHFPLEENKRTYSRISRRQSSTPDIPRPAYIKPEYNKTTRTYGVILDTSGSMDKNLLGKCLGAITSYSLAQEVKEIRLIFCDAVPYDEGFIPVEMLTHKIKVKGRGGTVLQQAVNYLENIQDFPKTAPILILTDGFFEETLTIQREHAFLVPNKSILPIKAKNIFEFQ